MRYFLSLFFYLFFALLPAVNPTVAQAQPAAFPTLSGNVVDNADLLTSDAHNKISHALSEFETATGNQIVVATIDSLNGQNIDEYANQLFRHWALGDKDKNNGVLLLVALNDRKMRIEVGYGLEGSLTDVIAHQIITDTLRPAFREKHYDQGTQQAVNAIIDAIKGEYSAKSDYRIGVVSGVVAVFASLMFVFGSIALLPLLMVSIFKPSIRQSKVIMISMKTAGYGMVLMLLVAVFGIAGDASEQPLSVLQELLILLAYGVFLWALKRFFQWVAGWKLWAEPYAVSIRNQPTDGGGYSSSSSSYSSSSSSSSSYSGGGGSSGGGGASGGW